MDSTKATTTRKTPREAKWRVRWVDRYGCHELDVWWLTARRWARVERAAGNGWRALAIGPFALALRVTM